MKLFYISIFVLVGLFSTAQTAIIAEGDSWKYYDQGTDLGTSWRTSSFNDAAWSSGNAILGYGSINAGTVNTTVSYGPDANNKYPTTYFRKTFNYSTTGNETYYKITLLSDDGSVVYLNGAEIERLNMPAGAISYSTWAASTGDENNYTTYTIAANLIQNGSNTLAVEVHQRSGSSSDIGFDFSLTAHFDLNIRFIHFGSKGNPLKGMRITWRDDTGNDSIKWGYNTSYSQGQYKAISRELYSDSLYEYSFPTLTPSSVIHYSIYSASFDAWSQDMTYKTSVDTTSTHFKFVSFGDCRTYLSDWKAVSSKVPEADFTLFNGDIINNGGVGSDWDDWFDYGNDFISSHIVYHTFGNHENQGTGSSNYDNLYVLPENPSGSEKYYSFTFGNSVFICLDSEHPGDATQFNWLTQTLSDNSDKTWKVIWFHKPFYTSPSHTTDMHGYWNTWWKAFDDYGVDVIINGHTHNYQRTKPINRNISTTAAVDHYGSCSKSGRCQIVTGRAGAPAVGVGSGWFIHTSSADLHYGMAEIDDNTFTFVVRDTTGSVLDSFRLIKDFELAMSSTPEGPVGSANGSATTSPSGGYSPYTYLWDDNSTTASISNLDSGWYSVTVTDNDNCELSSSVHVDTTSAPQYVTTDDASSILITEATLNATIKPPSGGYIAGMKFQIGTSDSYGTDINTSPTTFTTSNTTVYASAVSLSPSTTYHFRIVGQDGAGTYFGADKTFTTTTASAPTVDIGSDFSNISSTAAENSANEVTGDGGSAITERGVVYSTSTNPTLGDSKKTSSGTTGVYDITLISLTHSTTYYVKAYATNSVGTTYSALEKSFTTEPQIQAKIDSLVPDDQNPDYITVHFTYGNGDGTMLIIRENSDVSKYPVDGVSADTYNYDANYGDGYNLGEDNFVVYNGGHAKGDITISGIDNTKEYYFAIIEYSGEGSETNYRTGDPSKSNTTNTNLPIELISFNIENQDSLIMINWATASEHNNDFFEIQKSTNGEDFNTIASIKGAGNSNQINNYSIKDYQIVNGISYYRIKQTDFDGKFTYSMIKVLYLKNNSSINISNISVDNGVLNFIYNSTLDQNNVIQLIDISGKIVYSTAISGAGSKQHSIPMGNLSHGVYLIQLITDKNSLNYKVVY